MINKYLFSLLIGFTGVIFAYIESLQANKKLDRVTYIKIFIGSSIISLITSYYFCNQISKYPMNMSRQTILTGSPNF